MRSVLMRAVMVVMCVAVAWGAVGCKSAAKRAQERAERGGGVVRLTDADVRVILDNAVHAAEGQTSAVRVGADGQRGHTRMHIVVVSRNGAVKGRRSMEDAWAGSLQIATSKAWTAASFSSNENALSTRSIGMLSQPGGALWQIGNIHHGLFEASVVEFPGGLPLYKEGVLVGGIGVSGDGVDEDEAVAKAGARGFEPREEIRVDRVTGGGVGYVKE